LAKVVSARAISWQLITRALLPVLFDYVFLLMPHKWLGVVDSNPATVQFQDPLNYMDTYGTDGADIDFMVAANNHQNDYHLSGLETTIATMNQYNIPNSGLAHSAADSRAPRVVSVKGLSIAFFTAVLDECWQWPNGTLYLDGCTCGDNAGVSPPYQCYQANSTFPGLWYYWGITDDNTLEISSVVKAYKQANPTQLVVMFLHVGPNFQWYFMLLLLLFHVAC
jgi:hypothetical protein